MYSKYNDGSFKIIKLAMLALLTYTLHFPVDVIFHTKMTTSMAMIPFFNFSAFIYPAI